MRQSQPILRVGGRERRPQGWRYIGGMGGTCHPRLLKIKKLFHSKGSRLGTYWKLNNLIFHSNDEKIATKEMNTSNHTSYISITFI